MGRNHLIRFQQANEHLKALGAGIDEWKKSVGKTAVGDPDPEDPRFQVFYIQNNPIPSKNLSPIVADIVQSLRASLDDLCFELATAFSGPLSAEQAEHATFPIHRNEAEYRKGTEHLLNLVGSEVAEIMQRLQPNYTRPDKGPEWDLLWQLHKLATADPSDGLVVVNTVVGRWSIEAIVPEGYDLTGAWFRTGIPPKGRAPIARLPLLPAGSEDGVMRKVEASLDVALRDPPSAPAGDPVYEVLVDIARYIQSRVFSVLAPKLTATTPQE